MKFEGLNAIDIVEMQDGEGDHGGRGEVLSVSVRERVGLPGSQVGRCA